MLSFFFFMIFFMMYPECITRPLWSGWPERRMCIFGVGRAHQQGHACGMCATLWTNITLFLLCFAFNDGTAHASLPGFESCFTVSNAPEYGLASIPLANRRMFDFFSALTCIMSLRQSNLFTEKPWIHVRYELHNNDAGLFLLTVTSTDVLLIQWPVTRGDTDF